MAANSSFKSTRIVVSMFVFLNSTLQVLQKISLLNNKQYIKQTINISMDAISTIILFLLWTIWFTTYYCLNRFLYLYKIFQLTEQNMYVQVTYINPMFCTYVLHKRHGQFCGAHSWILFLNSVGDTIFFNSIGKMSLIFGPKLDVVSEQYMTILIQWNLPKVDIL